MKPTIDYDFHIKEAARIENELRVKLGARPAKRFLLAGVLFVGAAQLSKYYPQFDPLVVKVAPILMLVGLWYLSKLIGASSITVRPYIKRDGNVGYNIDSPFCSVEGPLYGGKF